MGAVTHVNQLYTGCFVTLTMDDKQYHPTELKLSGETYKYIVSMCKCSVGWYLT